MFRLPNSIAEQELRKGTGGGVATRLAVALNNTKTMYSNQFATTIEAMHFVHKHPVVFVATSSTIDLRGWECWTLQQPGTAFCSMSLS